MNIQQFQYVLAVAEHRHFETAAEKCFISQSTLSTMISKLEDELGVIIFNRKKKPVDITREGQEIIAQLRVINFEITQLNELVKKMTGEITGTLKIGCIATVAPYLLPLILYDFSVKYPGLSLEIKESTTDEIVSLIKSRELDTGIISTPLNDKELIEYPVYREPFVLYDTSGMHTGEYSLRDMNWDNFWLLEEGHCLSDQILEICSSGNAHIKSHSAIHFKTGSIDSLVRFVKTYKGQTLLPSLAVRDFREEDRRYVVSFVHPAPSRTIGLVAHQHFANKQILELLQNEIRLKTALLNEIEVISP